MALAAEIGLLAGLPAASLDPWAPMTRGEVAQVLDTLADLVDGQTSESRFRPVLQPYHNHYYHYLGFASGVSTLSLQPVQAVVDRTFPESVPAYYAPLRPVPSGTDLAFRSWASPGQFPPGTEEILAWQDPAMEELLNLRRDLNNPHPPPLHDGRVVLPIFRSFLADHGLWQTDLGSGTAEWGQTVVGPGIYRAATVRVTFDQTGVSGDGTLPGQLRGDVAAGDRPVTLSWALLDPQVMGQVPLRPLGDVLLDTEAWLDGDVTWDRWPSPEGHDFALAVTGVFLDYERIRSPLTSDSVGLTLVPVYRFAVQVIGPADSRGATGLWTVCAAANATGTGN
ncbi:MAG: hypothetical protein M5U22_08335 [Thermoleophilia bacterium]|nr:hypothetical protein [Thermoleophilia bacterium]